MPEADPFDLQRFVAAQDHGGIYDRALAELVEGRKRGHWMWFVFPQLAGLGASPMSQRYAISSLAEARAYLDHAVLGPRLLACCDALIRLGGGSAEEILGWIDAVKLRSSMTLFARADPEASAFRGVLDTYLGGEADDATDRLLAAQA
jgi:uncharacterized protein (DUF1810 family)